MLVRIAGKRDITADRGPVSSITTMEQPLACLIRPSQSSALPADKPANTQRWQAPAQPALALSGPEHRSVGHAFGTARRLPQRPGPAYGDADRGVG